MHPRPKSMPCRKEGFRFFLPLTIREEWYLAEMMKTLAEKEINEIHVEAGATLNGALIQAGYVDEMLIYLAPCFLGSGKNMLSLNQIDRLADRIAFDFHEIVPIGHDLRILARLTD